MVETFVLPALLGLGLAAGAGLRTFLPLLLLALAARFGLFGVELNDKAAWLNGDLALITLGIATALELAADKVPVLDNLLSAVGTVTRPLAGALAAGAVFGGLDPAAAAVAGLVIGAPTALAVHTVQTGARLISTTATAGLANPVVSVLEDIAAVLLAAVAFLTPVLVPVALIAFLWIAWTAAGRLKGTRPKA